MAISLHVRKPPSERFPSAACLQLIKSFEGWSANAYQDEGGIWTIGWGFTQDVRPGDVMDLVTGEARLMQEVTAKATQVREKVNCDLTQGEFDALVSYEYNVRGGLKPSLLACLNGGTTDTGENVGPGDYEKAVPQIVRAHWGDRPWAGKTFPDGVPRKIKTPIRGLYRRRLAEACVFKSLSEWQGPTSLNVIKMEVEAYQDKAGVWKARSKEDDTTEPEWVFEKATEEMRFKPPPVDMEKPFPEVTPQPAKKAPSSPQDAQGGEDELVLADPIPPLSNEVRAAPEVHPEAGAGSLAGATQPSGDPAAPPKADTGAEGTTTVGPTDGERTDQKQTPTATSKKSAPGREVGDRPGSVPGEAGGAGVNRPAPAPVGTKPPSPNTKMPEHVPYRIDPNAGLKPMEETERFVGAALMFFGTLGRVAMANGVKFSGVGGIFLVAILDMMKSPTNLAILVSVIALIVTGGAWCGFYCMDRFGFHKKKRGERTSTQGMY